MPHFIRFYYLNFVTGRFFIELAVRIQVSSSQLQQLQGEELLIRTTTWEDIVLDVSEGIRKLERIECIWGPFGVNL